MSSPERKERVIVKIPKNGGHFGNDDVDVQELSVEIILTSRREAD